MIRAATPADAEGWAALETRSWRRAFVDVVEESEMPSIAERRACFEQRGPADAWVWDQDGRLAGVVRVSSEPDGRSGGRLHALYVEPAAQGAGIGTGLHDHALDALRARGVREATLAVFAANGQAREFYAARGWRPDGAAEAWQGIAVLRYRRGLAP